jgi:hypothetical protein
MRHFIRSRVLRSMLGTIVAALPFYLGTPAQGQQSAVSPQDKRSALDTANPPTVVPLAVTRTSPDVARLSMVKQSNGNRLLQIDFPWQAYQKPSVEIWLFTSDNPPNTRPRPMYFVDHHLKGDTSVKVGRCLSAAYGVGLTQSVTHDALDFDIVGRRNSLGRPAVSIAWSDKRYPKDKSQQDEDKARQKPTTTENAEDAPPQKFSAFGAWVVFCELENWSTSGHQLSLDLPTDYFAKPGQLYIWFLRNDTVLWEQQLNWKGY